MPEWFYPSCTAGAAGSRKATPKPPKRKRKRRSPKPPKVAGTYAYESAPVITRKKKAKKR